MKKDLNLFLRFKEVFKSLDAFSRLALIFIFFSLILRFYSLTSIPYGIDFDESIILYFGKKFILEGEFYAYADNYTFFEMLPAYLYGFFDLIFPFKARIGASFVAVLELGLFYFLSLKVFKRRDYALISLAFLALLPWHLFYSRIIGTCNGVNIFTILSFLVSSYSPHVNMVYPLGLLYYSGFRMIFIARGLHLILFLKGKKRVLSISFLISSFLLTLFIIFFSHSFVLQFFYRGTYNWNESSQILKNLFYSLIFPFTPAFEYYSKISSSYIADFIHEAFVSTLSNSFPLSLPITCFFFIGLFTFFCSLRIEQVVMQEQESEKKMVEEDKKKMLISLLLILFICYICVGFLGPSFSRFIVILPPVVIFSSLGFFKIKERVKTKYSFFLLAFSLLFMFFQNVSHLMRLSNDEKLVYSFHPEYLYIDHYIADHLAFVKQEDILVPARAFHYIPAYIAQTQKRFTVPGPVPPGDLIAQIKSEKKGKGAFYLILRSFEKSRKEGQHEIFFSEEEYIKRIRHYLHSHFEILERGEIKNREQVAAEFYKLSAS